VARDGSWQLPSKMMHLEGGDGRSGGSLLASYLSR
jgi:hypothetical protein